MTADTSSLVNPANVAAAAAAGFEAPPAVTVVDCTLREGEQMAGVVLSRDDKLRVAHALVEAGTRELEVGMPAVSAYEAQTIRALADAGLGCRIFVVCLATREDILRAGDCGVDGVSVSLPAGRLQIEKKFGWSLDRIVDTAVEMSLFAREQGLLVTLSPYDTPRAELDFLERYLTSMRRDGHVDRVRFVDTVGSAAPQLVSYLVPRMRAWLGGDVPIEMHCHNDFGLGVANTLAGVGAGASAISTTVAGIGERAGNAPTEQVVAALELLYGVDTGLDLTALPRLVGLVREVAGIGGAPHDPIVGSRTFTMESGAVVAGYLSDPRVAFPFPPALVGASVRIALGKKSGRHAVRAKLAEGGLDGLDEAAVARLLARVKDHAQETGADVPDERFFSWARDEAELRA